jgi:beta-galactosidase
LAWLLDKICAAAGLRPALDAPQGVEAIRRSDGERTWLFLLNHTAEAVQIDLPDAGVNVLTGEEVNASIRLEPKGVAIIRQKL